MNTRLRQLHSAGLFQTALVSALLLAPLATSAQTYFGVGGPTNNFPPNFANLAFGYQALFSNTTGTENTAIGFGTLYSNTTGYYNTANGYAALYNNTTGYYNTANGSYALLHNTTGTFNTVNGMQALYSNTNGNNNIADGYDALANNTTGNSNIGVGTDAGFNLTTGSNNIDIGNTGVSAESGVIRIGTAGTHNATYVAGVNGVNILTGVDVYISSNGQLGTIKSSRRFKKDIHDMGSVSDKLMQLRPVTFRYKQAAEDGTHPVQYGLIAEEVAKLYPDLVQYDKQGKPFTIYYHLLTPMLLNELQKTHRENVAQKTAMKAAQAKIAMLTVAQKAARAETASLKAALQAQSAELAALKQSEQQQLASITAKLTALAQASQNSAQVQRAVYTQRKRPHAQTSRNAPRNPTSDV